MIIDITNKLFEYSNHYITIRIDNNIRSPAYSIIEKRISGRHTPTIIINEHLLFEDENVIAHVLAHEWGHHVCKHMTARHLNIQNSSLPIEESDEERQKKENEADLYARNFIEKYSYNTIPIIEFIKKYPIDFENRLDILIG